MPRRDAAATLEGIAMRNDGSIARGNAFVMSAVIWALLMAANDIAILFIEK